MCSRVQTLLDLAVAADILSEALALAENRQKTRMLGW
jgi:hypothetical protein